MQAIEEAGSTDKAAVVEAMKNIQFDGVTGHIIFDEERNPIKGVMINKLTNGTIEYVESYEKERISFREKPKQRVDERGPGPLGFVFYGSV